MPLFDQLFECYTFENLIKIAINLIGISNLMILFLSYIAVLIYISKVPSMSSLSDEMGKIRVFSLIQQSFYIFSFILIFKLIFKFDWNYLFSLIHFTIIYIAILFPLVLIIKNISKLSTYESYLALRKMGSIITLKRFWTLALFWFLLLSLFLYFMICDPSLPLICWILTFYSLASALIIMALVHSFILHITQSKYVVIRTDKGKQYEGFLICKDDDLYNIKTDTGEQLILKRQIEEITIKDPPKKLTNWRMHGE